MVLERQREKKVTTVVVKRCVNPFSSEECEEFCLVEVLEESGFLGGCSCGGPGVSSVCGSVELLGVPMVLVSPLADGRSGF